MFSWFRPQSPLPSPEKLWIEQRLSWLVRVFGLERLRSAAVILPTPAFFPDAYQPEPQAVRHLLDRICGLMGVDPSRIDLEFLSEREAQIGKRVGDYRGGAREQIRVATSQLQDLPALIATLAHETAHVLLLGDGRMTPDEWDHEQVTDLLTVFLGLGVICANSVMRESSKTLGQWHFWRLSRQGYLSEREYGYALAVFAYARGEANPPWARHLRPNVRSVTVQGLRYLLKTNDSQFRMAEEALDEPARAARRRDSLKAPSSGARLAALWEFHRAPAAAEAALPEVTQLLKDPDSYVQVEAAWQLAALGPSAAPVLSELCEAATSRVNGSLRPAAAAALGRIGQATRPVLSTLIDLLRDEREGVRRAAAESLGRLGPAAASACQALAKRLNVPSEQEGIAAAVALNASNISVKPQSFPIVKSGLFAPP
jgi:hypothetical protein